MQLFGPYASGNTRVSWAILVSLCLGIFLRVHNFWVPDLWLDEYGTWWVISASTWSEVAARATEIQGQSPFYYLIVKLFTEMLGEGSFQLRLPSVIFGSLTLLVAVRLALRIFHDQNLALVSTAVFSVTEQMIWTSQSARPYALALLLTLCSFLFFLDLIQSQGTRHCLIYAVTTALLIYSHFLFALVLGVQVVILIIKFGWRELFCKYWLWSFLLILVLCLPLSGQIVSLYQRRQTLDWVPHFVQATQASAIARGFADPWALVLATLTLVIVQLRAIDLREPAAREILSFLVGWLVIPLAALWTVATIAGVSLFAAHYILMVYPAAYFLWAWLLLHVKPAGSRRWLPSGVFVVATLTLTTIPHLIENGTFRRSGALGWGQAATTLKTFGRPGDLVVFYSGFIEADLFVQRPQDGNLSSYVAWPLLAHLPANHNFTLLSLPLQQNARTDSYIQSLEIKAAKRDRVWVVAPDKQRNYFNDAMITQFGFQPVAGYSDNNETKVSLLVRSNSGT